MDTIGSNQLDVMDVEAIFPRSKYRPQEVENYLRNVTLYLFNSRPQFKKGDAIDGPNETNLSWTLEVLERGLTSPPREVLRLYPKESTDVVLEAVGNLKG